LDPEVSPAALPEIRQTLRSLLIHGQGMNTLSYNQSLTMADALKDAGKTL